MADRVLLGASRRTFTDCLELARKHDLGLEIQTFAYPDVLSDDWKSLLHTYQRMLIGFTGPRALHGPFIDMAAGSPDPLIRDVVRARMMGALDIAAELQATTVVFHANFIASMRNKAYRREFQDNQLEYWPILADRAASLGITIALENMWEFEPQIIADVLSSLNMPSLRACLDVGHARLFSDPQHSIEEWIDTMAPFLVHIHLNNNPGTVDEHRALDEGVIDYDAVLPLLRALPHQPTFSLEMSEVQSMRKSLRFFKLRQTSP